MPESSQSRRKAAAPDRAAGFAPIAGPGARLLILGTLPSRRSLAVREYYAHPQNAFWPIMADLFGATGSYRQRCDTLAAQGVVVWDVLGSSVRPGSADADIDIGSAVPNDFAGLLAAQPGIVRIGFNGQSAGKLFRRLVLPCLDTAVPELVGLPSTSPRFASMPYDEKLRRWREFATVDPTRRRDR